MTGTIGWPTRKGQAMENLHFNVNQTVATNVCKELACRITLLNMQNHRQRTIANKKKMNNWSTYWIIGRRAKTNGKSVEFLYINVTLLHRWWPFSKSGMVKKELEWFGFEPTYVYHSRLRVLLTIGNHLFYILDRFSTQTKRIVCIRIIIPPVSPSPLPFISQALLVTLFFCCFVLIWLWASSVCLFK